MTLDFSPSTRSAPRKYRPTVSAPLTYRPTVSAPFAAFGLDARKVGGIQFLRLGRLTVSVSRSAEFRPLGAAPNLSAVIRANRERRAAKRRRAEAWHAAGNVLLIAAATVAALTLAAAIGAALGYTLS